jgi:HAD superfamily hydrolase (TIGR01549 family)
VTSFILDFDGTLYRLAVDYPETARALYREFPAFFPTGAWDKPGALVGFLATASARERREVVARVAALEAVGVERGGFWSDALPFLIALRERGVPHGILTRNCRSTVTLAFRKAGLWPPPATVGLDDDVPPKPDPAATRLLLERLGSDPTDVVVVGDTTHDVAVADALDCARVLRFNPALPRPPSDPRALHIRTFAELELDRWLRGLP